MEEEQIHFVAGIPKFEIYDGTVFANNAPFSGRVSLVLKVAGKPWAQASVALQCRSEMYARFEMLCREDV